MLVLGWPRAPGIVSPPTPPTPVKPVVKRGATVAGFVQAMRRLPVSQKHSCLQGRGGRSWTGSLGGTSKSFCSQAGPQADAGGNTGAGTRGAEGAEVGWFISGPAGRGSGTDWLTVCGKDT